MTVSWVTKYCALLGVLLVVPLPAAAVRGVRGDGSVLSAASASNDEGLADTLAAEQKRLGAPALRAAEWWTSTNSTAAQDTANEGKDPPTPQEEPMPAKSPVETSASHAAVPVAVSTHPASVASHVLINAEAVESQSDTPQEDKGDDLFQKKPKKKIPEDLNEYCQAGGHQDPACDVNAPAKELKDEIADVFKHIRAMMADKDKARKKKNADRKNNKKDIGKSGNDQTSGDQTKSGEGESEEDKTGSKGSGADSGASEEDDNDAGKDRKLADEMKKNEGGVNSGDRRGGKNANRPDSPSAARDREVATERQVAKDSKEDGGRDGGKTSGDGKGKTGGGDGKGADGQNADGGGAASGQGGQGDKGQGKDGQNKTGKDEGAGKRKGGAMSKLEQKRQILNEARKVNDKVKELEGVKDKLEKDGKLDRELDHEISKLIDDANNMDKNFKDLAEADGDKELDAALGGLEDATRKTAGSLSGLETGVAPNEWKWWRFRYEYSFVESLCLICILVLVLFFDAIHHCLQEYIFEPEDQRKMARFEESAYFNTNVMRRRWLCLLFGQLSVLGFVQLVIWLFSHCGLFAVIPTEVSWLHGMHLPRNEVEYARMIRDVFVHLFISIILYYLLSGSIMRSGEKRISQWEYFENTETPRKSVAANADAMTVGLNNRYPSMRKYFESCLAADQTFNESIGTPRAENGQTDFPFCKYLKMSVRERVETYLCIHYFMWFGTLVCLVLCCYLNYLRIAFLQITAVITALVFVCIAFVTVWVWFIGRCIVSYQENEKMDKNKVSWLTGGDYYIAKCFQFFTFFTCYGCARIIGSPYMWTLQPVLAGCLVAAYVVFWLLFVTIFAHTMLELSILMALPPYVGPKEAVNIAAFVEEYKLRSTSGRRVNLEKYKIKAAA